MVSTKTSVPPSDPSSEPSFARLPTAKLSAFSRFLLFKETISRSTTPKHEFPPTSWDISEDSKETGASEWKYDPERWKQEILDLRESVRNEGGDVKVTDEDGAPAKEKGKEREKDELKGAETEPQTLAQKIKGILDTLGTSDAKETKETRPPLSSARSTFSIPTIDSALGTLLYSESVMKGAAAKSKESVWSLLEKMGPTRKKNAEDDNDDGSIMLYAPLSPTTESEPEVAKSDVVEKLTKTRREWRPSPSKISIEATWWGYKLYLPPPVLAILSDAHLTAVKRGALVTAALKWLLDRVPILLVPPTLRPGLTVLKRLSPYLGYVGAFIAWSWEKIKEHDQGDGVVLTATWLLPIALIPDTWNPEVHGHSIRVVPDKAKT